MYKKQGFIYYSVRSITMQDFPYSTTRIIYHNKLSNIHDLDSYILFMRYAWIDYPTEIVMALVAGFIIGLFFAKHLYNSEVLQTWIQNQTWIQKLQKM